MTCPDRNHSSASSSTACSAALKLAAQGYACFPCRPDKKPACTHGFKDASTHDEDIKALWSEFPGPLIGVTTGPASQIAVLDIDAKHEAAKQWWGDNRPGLPATRTHRTRSGGLHLVYGDCDGLKCSVSKIAKGVDVRADGGYIIWWPAAGMPVLSEAPIAPWPEWLIPEPPPPPASRQFPSTASNTHPSIVEARVEGLLRFAFDAPVGERNARLYWAACRLRDMVRARELDIATGDQAFEELRQIGVHVGLANPEIIRTIKSAAWGKGSA